MQLITGQNSLDAFCAVFCVITQQLFTQNVAPAAEVNYLVQGLGLLKVLCIADWNLNVFAKYFLKLYSKKGF